MAHVLVPCASNRRGDATGALMPRKLLTILWQRGRKEFMS
jgi:hypothetical protein